jgi:hypothetical protein
MANTNFTANKDIQSAINRIVDFRKIILNDGYDSLFSHGEVNEKRRRSDHMTLCLMFDDLCNAVEPQAFTINSDVTKTVLEVTNND